MAANMKKTKANFAQMGVDDLVMLPKVTEENVIDNIKKRYMQDLIYTNIGPVLISVNPYRNLGNATQEYVEMYRGKFRHELPPHIFALAEETYRAMKGELENQCVIISGESGAGKTECAKMIMQYISAVSGSSEGVEYVKHVILESNPFLEAFGNAKTLRNNNSSRFGKYFEIRFNREGDPCGGRITNYLLEKSRVVFQTPGERNYHSFYQLLAGAPNNWRSEWALYDPGSYFYLNQGGCYQVDGINDVQEFADVNHAMDTIGVDKNTQAGVWQNVASILHLGNITFHEDGSGNGAISDKQALETAAYLLQVEPFTLENAILFRVVNTSHGSSGRGSTYNVPQNAEQAAGARDALAKAIYDRQFDWIVQQVNNALQKGAGGEAAVIGVLDIFGFEIFDQNGFEQFCINFVNEKLQQYFIELTLKAEQEEYAAEGIQWDPIKYFNNKIVCELMEGKQPPGIFSILDDVCRTLHAGQGGADSKFLGKVGGIHSSHLHYRGFDTAFSIKHYAGEVTYDMYGFTEKNKDTLFDDLVQAMQTSTNQFLVSLFPDDTSQKQKKRPTTAGFKIKNSAGLLMKALSQCSPHYVRCMKPNENKAAQDWDDARCLHQVTYLGLYENVRVRRAGFAFRAPFLRFLNRYKRLSPKTWGMWGEWTGSDVDGCRVLLESLGIEGKQFQMGRTKIFIRHPETLFYLEEQLERRDYECAVKIQRAWQKWKLQKHSLEQRAAVANVYKGRKERQRYSVERSFTADYISYEHNYELQKVVPRGERVIFADQIVKFNRRGRPERRDFIMTDRNLYFAMRKKQGGATTYVASRTTPLTNVASISLSDLSDNYIAIMVPNEYDFFFENQNKTEIVALLMEYCQAISGRQIPVNFSNSITYKLNSGDTRTMQFQSDPSQSKVALAKQGKTTTAKVPQGLPKDTDSTPKMISGGGARTQRRVNTPGPSVSSSSRGGRGGARTASPAAASSSSSSSSFSRGGGAARGRGAAPSPARGGGPRGAPRGGARGSPRGAARGGPAGRATSRGGPAARATSRGGPAARATSRGGPAARATSRGGPARGGARGARGARGGARGGPARGGARGGAARGGARGRGAPRGRGGPARGRGGGPASPPSLPKAKALWAFSPQQPDEVAFAAGDVVTIKKEVDNDWWEVEINGKIGFAPSSYLEKM